MLDFNLAKSVHQPQGWVADTPCGTSPYIAPEVLSHQRYSQVCPVAVHSHKSGCPDSPALNPVCPALHSRTVGLAPVEAVLRLSAGARARGCGFMCGSWHARCPC